MKAFYISLLSLLTCSCTTTTPAGPATPLSSTNVPVALDSVGHVRPDSLRMLEGPKTVEIGSKKIKLKKGATLVIQTGQNNSTTTFDKTKNSTLANGAGASAIDNTKAGNKADGGVAVGEQAAATGSTQTKEAGWPWYIWLLLLGAIGYGLYTLKSKLGF